jgi:hypothetical protein
MALLSEETVHVLARWICLNLPLNVYATTFGMAANMLGVREGGRELKVRVEGQLIFNTIALTLHGALAE